MDGNAIAHEILNAIGGSGCHDDDAPGLHDGADAHGEFPAFFVVAGLVREGIPGDIRSQLAVRPERKASRSCSCGSGA